MEICANDNSFITHLSLDQLRQHFPNLVVVDSPGRYSSSRLKDGVYAYISSTDVAYLRVVGPCPSWKGGGCERGESCFLRIIDPESFE